jgi:hypothetical protein
MGQIITVQQIASILMCSVIGLSSTAFAADNYYKWIDHNGTMQYTQNPPPANARKVLKSIRVSTHVPADVRNRGSADPTTQPEPTTNALTNTTATASAVASSPSTPTAATPDQPATFNNDSVAPSNK